MDVRELARLFVYDPRACEKFVKKIIDTGMDCQLFMNHKSILCKNPLSGKMAEKLTNLLKLISTILAI